MALKKVIIDGRIEVSGKKSIFGLDNPVRLNDHIKDVMKDSTTDVIMAGDYDFIGDVSVDTIAESTSGAGVTVDGVRIKDGGIALGTTAVNTFTVLKTITAAEIVGTAAGDLGHASGVELVAAPGAGFALEFLDAVAIYDFDTAAYTGGGNDTTINIGSSGAAITGVVTSANLLGAAGDKIVAFRPLSTAALPVTANAGISMNSVTAWTQPGTAAGVLRVYTTYRVVTTGL